MFIDKTKKACDSICSKVWLSPIINKHDGIQKIGVEMEINAYDSSSLNPIGLENSRLDIQKLLKRIAELSPESNISIDEPTKTIIGVELNTGANFSAEPGGQIEYSSAPHANFIEVAKDVLAGLDLLEKAANGEVLFLSHGTNPIAKPDHPLLLPKERYQIMTRYFSSAPQYRGLDMMRHCSTIQANLDVFGDCQWQNAVNLITTIIPLTRYMFANSKYIKGEKSNFTSERQDVWDNMDPTRSGFPSGMPFTKNPECNYAQWAKKANVFLVTNLPQEEQPLFGELTFEQWLEDGYKGIYPSINDWETHLATLFPHLRLRNFLEIRHLDSQPFEHSFAPIVFFSVLAQCQETRSIAWAFIRKHFKDERDIFKNPKEEFNFIHLPLLDLVCELLSGVCSKADIAYNREFSSVLEAYRHFYLTRSSYWQDTPLEFVKKNATLSPASVFKKYLPKGLI